MRRTVVTVMALGLLALAAAPAHAQARDPFDPLVEESTTSGATGDAAEGAATEERSATEGTGVTQTVETAEGMPNTGSNADSWLVVAYVLLALGGAALAASKLLSGTPTRR